MNTRAFAKPRGFTLVELLVVITIIGILAGLALVAIPGAVSKVKEGGITAEIAQMEAALKLFKSDHGAFPPDYNSSAYNDAGRVTLTRSFLRKAFPRCSNYDWQGSDPMDPGKFDSSVSADLNAINNLIAAGCVSPSAASGVVYLKDIGPAEAMVVFLCGFSSDVEHPFVGSGDRKKYFDFAIERLQDTDSDGWLEYYPSGSTAAPYVYFNSSTYTGSIAGVAKFPATTGSAFSNVGQARPYYSTLGATSGFANPDTFQIIAPGIDGTFGDFPDFTNVTDVKVYPAGLASGTLPSPLTIEPYTTEDRDNITNFAQGPLRNKEPE